MTYDPLRDELINIASVLMSDDIKIIVGGGYGLLLRTDHILKTKPQTRFNEPPIARSTDDIDIFLSAEIITSVEKTEKIRDAILDAGFEPVTKHFQFQKEISLGLSMGKVKIDLLAAPTSISERSKLELGRLPRVRPRGAKRIHAYLTEEAVTIDRELSFIDISTDATPVEICVPHPYSYLILKLFAFRDRRDDAARGSYHAIDIYRIVGMMTEPEWNVACDLAAFFKDDPIVIEASNIVSLLFSRLDAEGVRHIRRYLGQGDTAVEHIEIMIEDLRALFPDPPHIRLTSDDPDKRGRD